MKKILEKRDLLERFIREQTLGPGINGYRFVDLHNEFLVAKNLQEEDPIEYENEILDIVPAALYSTGILFPEDDSQSTDEGVSNDPQEDIPDNVDVLDEEQSGTVIREERESIELNQMFPKLMGISTCIDEAALLLPLEVVISARYYRKLRQDKDGIFHARYGLLCELDYKSVIAFLGRYELNAFSIDKYGQNWFITMTRTPKIELKEIKTRIREIQKIHAEVFYDELVKIISPNSLTRHTSYLSNLKLTIYFALKNEVPNLATQTRLYDLSQRIELVENLTSHLIDILEVQRGSYGLWQSEIVKRTLRIENIDFPLERRKKVLTYRNINYTEQISIWDNGIQVSNGLEDIFVNVLNESNSDKASLSVNVQLSRDSRTHNRKIFLKVQLVNSSTPYKKENANMYYSTFNERVNQKTFFGVGLSISNERFLPYSLFTPKKGENGLFDEDNATRFIYREFKDYAIGHGCSAKWDDNGTMVETEYIPVCEIPDVDPIPRNKKAVPNVKDDVFIDPVFCGGSQAQEFKWLSSLSDTSDERVIEGLGNFIGAYKVWIDEKRRDEKYLGADYQIALQELDKCEEDLNRMQTNLITLLSGIGNRENLTSFRIMNSAMFMQLWHSVKAKTEVLPFMRKEDFSGFTETFYREQASDKLFSEKESASWRAFQLAFILLNLDGVFRPFGSSNWEQRNDWVDLVWFPTGGGKTEAYLGLIALTIINRRKIHGDFGGGTATIMRYTLRLLTLQQFQRATLLIMALELIRRWGNGGVPGIEPITIGLWVGDNSIPNTNNDLQKEIDKLNKEQSCKIPFDKCPWCSSRIMGETSADKEVKSGVYNQERIHLKCTNFACSFSFGKGLRRNLRSDKGPIPISISDESIYLHPPALLLGTVDKFAQLAHKTSDEESKRHQDSRRLFGKGNWEAGKPQCGYLPPDLIIQDELHLLLGPLGSAVGLFESAIDQLCTRTDGTRAKYISSTATTRNTNLQIGALFDRKVNLFPKPGVECDDSFFAFYKRTYANVDRGSQKFLSKRKYIGFLPTGKTQMWMQMRLSAIIMTHRAIFEIKELGENGMFDPGVYDDDLSKVMDYYHTTISYFTSLKEVGKTQSQVQSYILKEIRKVFHRTIRPKKLMDAIYTYGPVMEAELTGRLSGEEVKNELKKLESKWKANKRFASKPDKEVLKGSAPPEFVVATNMISVGIDVSRFNTIIMNSMPRNTAEYIQASSRVGRDSYGVVLTVHHPFRARDISHYEKFIEFHEKMYSFVEPISITPFTNKSIDRYMGLYLATMIRHTLTGFANRKSAANIADLSDEEIFAFVDRNISYFQQRSNRFSTSDVMLKNILKSATIQNIKIWIESAIQEWSALEESTDQDVDLVFANKRNSDKQTRKQEQLYVEIEAYEGQIHSKRWQVPMSLRVIEPEAAIKINLC